ncbi:MAG: hypothetical protein EBR02_01305 [Alphaproteobacteria bacterium]|nr:hypothetical protein [Alphaproteobacteria bacterium]
MTYFHYYATTAGKTDRILQYGVFPVALLAATLLHKGDPKKAFRTALAATGLCSAAMTTVFMGLESKMVSEDCRDAVSAELGIPAEQLKFSDFQHSKNIIARKAYKDFTRLQPIRYATDALFLLPHAIGTLMPNATAKYDLVDKLKDVGPGLAGKSGYWLYETYGVPKTSHYEIVKLSENIESTGKNIKADDLMGVYQRTRDDAHLKRIDIGNAEEHQALRPLLEKMADAYNKHDGKFGMSEIVYLIGMGKINIYAADNRTISQDAIKHSYQDIERVISVGLKGIAQQSHDRESGVSAMFAKNIPAKLPEKTFADSFLNSAVNVAQSIVGKGPKRREEWISVRNPGDSVDAPNLTASR